MNQGIPVPSLWINNKRGTFYVVTGLARNCTNDCDGQQMVVYQAVAKEGDAGLGLVFVREIGEFLRKFHRQD